MIPLSLPPFTTLFVPRRFKPFTILGNLSPLLSIAIVLLLLSGCNGTKEQPLILPDAKGESLQRIISTVPSITEVLFDIGLGPKLVGDSAFTLYPPEAAKIEKIGGLYDKNFEKIVSLKPDLVVCLAEDVDFQHRLARYGIEFLSVDHQSIKGVLASYEMIGKRLGADCLDSARTARNRLEKQFQGRNEQKGEAVHVLICVDRSRGTGNIQNLFIAANSPFYNEVLHLSGAVNIASTSINSHYASLSLEGLFDMKPEVIFDLQTGTDARSETARTDWDSLGDRVPAVKNRAIFVITEDYATIPGPRIPLLVEKMVKALESVRHGNH